MGGTEEGPRINGGEGEGPAAEGLSSSGPGRQNVEQAGSDLGVILDPEDEHGPTHTLTAISTKPEANPTRDRFALWGQAGGLFVGIIGTETAILTMINPNEGVGHVGASLLVGFAVLLTSAFVVVRSHSPRVRSASLSAVVVVLGIAVALWAVQLPGARDPKVPAVPTPTATSRSPFPSITSTPPAPGGAPSSPASTPSRAQPKANFTQLSEARHVSVRRGVIVQGKVTGLTDGQSLWLVDEDPDGTFTPDEKARVRGEAWTAVSAPIADPSVIPVRIKLHIVFATYACAKDLYTAVNSADSTLPALPPGCTIADTREIRVDRP
jgi:hypothetical protein